ncbi:c-type cytochrome [Parasedimentitalea psychrophila]|uniref:C-type cytochrome n=1 Tax=Parasedimentitalea psychrophila TaxID=2997337 RepID=A0A9Y2L3I9_9RHOB|nr:c-type cytochrome [Parasedimentitalea psychrophila]WIY26239.1 c-type cytochrome [Parasedimentitalea psychrophila]
MRMVFAALLSVLATGGLAQDVEMGENLFQHFCAGCHGEDAKGGGPMAPILLVQPANLTTLSARNGGEFPLERVAGRIDGRDPIVSHGSDMPVFGWLFQDQPVALKLPTGQPMLATRPVVDLITWMQTIQE